MKTIKVGICWCARYALVLLVLMTLLIAVLPITIYGQDPEPPDPTAKAAPPGDEAPEMPLADALAAGMAEGFEGALMPPPGWTHLQTNPNQTWEIAGGAPHSGSYYGAVYYDPNLLDQDEVLLSPSFVPSAGSMSLWSKGSLYWCRDTYDNCDLEVWFVNGSWDWGAGDDVYLGTADGDWTATWDWSHSAFDFSPHCSGEAARIALRYTGNDGAEIGVDDILIDWVTSCNDPHEPNDTPVQATPIFYGLPLTDPDICPAGDVDYYAFDGNAGADIAADIDAWSIGSSLDSVLHLYDTDGVTELASNDDWDGLDSRIEYTLPANGTYYLKVRDYGAPNGGPDYFYTISLIGVTTYVPLVIKLY